MCGFSKGLNYFIKTGKVHITHWFSKIVTYLIMFLSFFKAVMLTLILLLLPSRWLLKLYCIMSSLDVVYLSSLSPLLSLQPQLLPWFPHIMVSFSRLTIRLTCVPLQPQHQHSVGITSFMPSSWAYKTLIKEAWRNGSVRKALSWVRSPESVF